MIPFLLILIPVSCISCAYGQSINDYDYTRYALPGEASYAGKYRKNILDTLDKTNKYAVDINHDGEINCIDYSCTFKMLWDKSAVRDQERILKDDFRDLKSKLKEIDKDFKAILKCDQKKEYRVIKREMKFRAKHSMKYCCKPSCKR